MRDSPSDLEHSRIFVCVLLLDVVVQMDRVYDKLAEAFSQESVSHCFALLGDANMKFAVRLAEKGCDFIYVRHEHCAVAAAMAYARKSGKIGVACVTCGPGLTQLTTALPAAVRANIPLVIFAGEAPLNAAWYNQKIDQGPIVAATGAEYRPLHDVDQMLFQIREAFLDAQRRSAPIVLGVPMDVQNNPWDGPDALPAPSKEMLVSEPRFPADSEQIEIAQNAVEAGKKIIIVGGLGVAQSEAKKACKALASQVDGLLATTLPARGLFYDDPFSIGIAGGFSTNIARECFAEADLIIAVGCSLATHTIDSGKLWPKSKVLHIDLKPKDQNQGREISDFKVQSDASLAIEKLISK